MFRQDHNKLSHMGLANLRFIFPDSPGSGDESSSEFFSSPPPIIMNWFLQDYHYMLKFLLFFWGGVFQS